MNHFRKQKKEVKIVVFGLGGSDSWSGWISMAIFFQKFQDVLRKDALHFGHEFHSLGFLRWICERRSMLFFLPRLYSLSFCSLFLKKSPFPAKKRKDMGASFIVLVPKTEGAMSLKIRPLSLLRSVCKILATVLTN